MTALLLDMCVDRRHAAPAFLALAEGHFVNEWLDQASPDEAVLGLARQLRRILLTEDSDFGDLIFRDRLPPPPGVILAMTSLIPKAARAERFARLAPLCLGVALGNFVVLGPTHFRYRPLPS